MKQIRRGSSDSLPRNISERGVTNVLIIPLALLGVLVLGVGGMAISFYGEAQDYKNNVNKKIDVAVDAANQRTSDLKDKEFAEKEKSPYSRYDAPSSFGGLRILYPKTWSAYVAESRTGGGRPIDAYFAPGFVPQLNADTSVFALRATVDQRSYDNSLTEYAGKVKSGAITSQPYQSPNVPNVTGTRLEGEIVAKKQGVMVIMPLRNNTLKLWTESKDFTNDFDNVILSNFSFTP